MGSIGLTLYPADVASSWLFPTRKLVSLDRLFLRRDLVTTLDDANSRSLAVFALHHHRDMGVGRQCEASELQRHLPGDAIACVALVRRIVADMSGNPDDRLLRDHGGAVVYIGRLRHCSYSLTTLRIVLATPL